MGREIRMVPPNWQHPKQVQWSDGRLQPMFDETFESAAKKWKDGYAAWESEGRAAYAKEHGDDLEFWEYDGGPPERAYYRPWQDGEATWVQVWETVSEGTPVTPPFATKAELVDYLATKGDFWDQKRGDGAWKRASAEKFVDSGWAPSFMVQTSPAGSQVFSPRDGMPS